MPNAPRPLPRSLQDLPPRWAHFCLGIERFVADDLGVKLAGKRLAVGFSGGVDSTALLLCLRCLAARSGGRVMAAHLNHRLRPEADDDARWVADLCAALDVPCVTRVVDVASLAAGSGIGIEEAGREARYALYADVLTDHGVDFVVLGHHLDDLAEDVLMRLARGTAWPGLAGMPGRDDTRRLLRPLLLTPKAELVGFLTDLGVPWREDATNADQRWSRNRMRASLMPLLLRENPNFLDSMARLWRVAEADRDYWSGQTAAVGEHIPDATLAVAHRALRLRLYKAALDRLGPGQALADTLFALDRAWQDRRTGALFQFPGEKTAVVTGSGVVFSAKH
ncbi:tRNA lysidine(34) synthetase TilS [Pseudodesulfovibrio pelocollis]|uniref:tRNA lysidine(34) synthetase TilS n=1 Tax=Pseudodesulfovibrio pelocollis TaxID=3051432 RepID=UPI00255B32C3|nr:tRNA lysidine(34) synthetase TilS [Pseudodesulfovibrio sp. SB368]